MKDRTARSPSTHQRTDIRNSGGFIVSALSGGHGLFHWVDQSLVVMVPEIRDAFNLSEVGIGAIAATERVADGLVSAPAGIATDMHRRRWGLVLAVCMAIFGVGWLVVGAAPVFPVLLIGIALVAVSSSVIHLPAMAALSQLFPRKLGPVLGFHAVGGNIGDVLGPLVTTGLLLGVLSWRGVISVYARVPLALVGVVYWAFKNIGDAGSPAYATPTLRSQMELTRLLLKNKTLWGINMVSAMRNMTFVSLVWFLPIYFDDELGMSFQARGFHLAMLMLVGMLSTPLLGYLSDRYGRKRVIIPAMVSTGVLTLLLVPFGEGVPLIIILACMSLFLFSDQPILTAAALDIAGRRVVNTTLGVLAFTRIAPSAAAPLIAGWLYRDLGIEAIFYFVAAIFGLSALVMAMIPLDRSAQPVDEGDVALQRAD